MSIPGPGGVTNPDDSINSAGSDRIGPGFSVLIEEPRLDEINTRYPIYAPSTWTIVNYDASAYLEAAGPLLVRCDATTANITITLPLASSSPITFFHIVKIDSGANTVTIAIDSTDTWYGDTASQTLASQWKSVTLLSANNFNDMTPSSTSNASVSGWHVIATT